MSDNIKAAFDSYFRFKVGDLVVSRVVVEAFKAEADLNGPREPYMRTGGPNGGVVGEREARECHGGVQGFYLVYERDGGSVMINRYPEHALESWATAVDALRLAQPERPSDPALPALRKQSPETIKARIALLQAQLADIERDADKP